MRIKLLLLCSIYSIFAVAQSVSDEAAKLQHFAPQLPDRSLAPCQDFYKSSCQKWFSASPIPADQVVWGTGSGLTIWNLDVSREPMELAAAKKAGRSQIEQQVGDYWSACMDEKGIDAAAVHQLAPELHRIDAIKDKAGVIEEVAHLHATLPSAWAGNDNQTPVAMFGFGSSQDLDDASLVILALDQGGLALPSRDFYLKDDAKSVEIRNKYQAHVRKMFELSCESKEDAAPLAPLRSRRRPRSRRSPRPSVRRPRIPTRK